MKNIEKWIIIILSVITIAAIGTAVYFGINSTEKKNDNDKVVDTNKEDVKNPDNDEEQEDNKEAVAFCEANKDKIYKKIIENRNNSLAAKYDKKLLDDLYKISSEEDLNCNYAYGEQYYMTLYYQDIEDPYVGDSSYIIFDKELLSFTEYQGGLDEDYEINEAFALNLSFDIITAKEAFDDNYMYYGDFLKVYDDRYILVDVEVLTEGSYGDVGNETHIYEVDLKTKTYKRLK